MPLEACANGVNSADIKIILLVLTVQTVKQKELATLPLWTIQTVKRRVASYSKSVGDANSSRAPVAMPCC